MHRTVEGVDQTWYTKVGARSAHPSCSLADRLEMHAQGFAEHLISVAPDLVPNNAGVEGHPFHSRSQVLWFAIWAVFGFPYPSYPIRFALNAALKHPEYSFKRNMAGRIPKGLILYYVLVANFWLKEA